VHVANHGNGVERFLISGSNLHIHRKKSRTTSGIKVRNWTKQGGKKRLKEGKQIRWYGEGFIMDGWMF